MSRYEVLLIRFALYYLLATALFGLFFMFRPEMAGYFRTTHVHFGVLGFFLSMVMGVAYWMMPRPGQMRQEGFEAVTFYSLNLGLILRGIGEPWWRYSGGELPQLLTVISGVFLLMAIASFVVAMHARVRTKETIIRLRMENRSNRES